IADRIAHLSPCEDAARWAAKFTSPAKAWNECPDGSWMLWIIGRIACAPESDDGKRLVLCTCECARLALPLFEKRYPNDARVRKCIETAEQGANGEATIEELRKSRAAAANVAMNAIAIAAGANAAATAAATTATTDDAAATAAAAAYAADAATAAAIAAAAAADTAIAIAAGDVNLASAASADTATGAATAYAYANAADADAAEAARSTTLAKCANIVRKRKHYPKPPVIAKKSRGA
ncbi:MAG: hypothetical protein L0Z50_20910, partial [Verrucomicrobiales bacterium]|nr:hypothetical protein [Verrucomicrobiales bacterium]